jgi:hypothetical protein
MRSLFFLLVIVPVLAAAQMKPGLPIASSQNASPQHFKLPATPKTVAWGYYDAAAPPVLRIHSGDTV